MSIYLYKNAEINYEYSEVKGKPVIVFINGLTQRVQHWKLYKEYFNNAGYSVLLFDLMGQGASVKPALFIDFKDNQAMLAGLFDHLNIEKAYIAGISFGGVVTLRFGIEYPERTKGLIPMSTFSEMDGQLHFIGKNLYEGMVTVGFEYLVKLFVPFNFSANWIENNTEKIPIAVRESFNSNDLFGIQNMMESLERFQGFTPDLKKITAPTLILNGEFDYLTPRKYHEIMRKEIDNSRLMIMQHVCHAFTLEIPQITCRVIENFLNSVENKTWKGDKSVWIASDSIDSVEIAFPCEGDYTRSIPILSKINNPNKQIKDSNSTGGKVMINKPNPLPKQNKNKQG